MLYHTNRTVLSFNGTFKNVNDFKISPFNQTLHYGYGVFDGIRSYNTAQGPHLYKIRRHFERLVTSAERLGMVMPFTSQELINYAYELIERNKMKEAYVRPLVFMDKNMSLRPDSEHPNVLMTCWKWTKYYEHNRLSVMVSSLRRPHPRTTHVDTKIVGHFANDILATKEAKDKGYDEALMLDIEGYVAQGPGCSFFYEKGGVLYTPPSEKVFPSITKATLIEIAKQMGIEVVEKEFGVEDVIKADGAFYVGTAA